MNESFHQLTRVDVSVDVPIKEGNAADVQDRAYAVMTEMERYPAYMDSVSAVEVLERRGDKIVARWDASIDGAPIRWVQLVHCDETLRQMVFSAQEGDFDVFKGYWSVSEKPECVQLNLVIEYRLGIPVIEEVLGPILKEKVAANSTAMLAAIAEQVIIENEQ